MVRESVIIKNPTGLHLRPAGLFCKTAMQFGCKITIEKTARPGMVSAKSGDEITIVCDGEDEEDALKEMVQIVKDGLGE